MPPADAARITLTRFPGVGELQRALTARLAQAFTSVGADAPAGVMLSGGATPLPSYAELARRPVRPAPQLFLLYSDERHVPAAAPASNYGRTRELLDALGLPDERVLRVRTELPPDEAAEDYERRIAAGLDAGGSIALGLLGLGADGHTAGLFTAADLERAAGRLAIAVRRPDGMAGVSVTPTLLARVASVLLPVTGAGKRCALARLLRRDPRLVAWRALAGCREVEVWTEPEAAPAGA